MKIFTSTQDNQSFSVRIGNNTLVFRIRTFRGIVYIDIGDGVNQIVTGRKALPNAWILPKRYNDSVGNVMFSSREPDGSDYPTCEDLSGKFALMVYTPEEMSEMGDVVV